jgi:large subunit ribosomal protein L34
MKPSYNPSKISRVRKCGFRRRMRTAAGRAIIANRRRIGRRRLTVV